jgi:hypothetical protein
MFTPILRLVVAVQLGAAHAHGRLVASDRGQSTAEYAMVLAGIALLVAAVFTKTDIFSKLWDTAIAAIHIGGK